MIKFFARCAGRSSDSITVNKSSTTSNNLAINVNDDRTTSKVLLNKSDSLRLASDIFSHYGIDAPDYREYGVFMIPYFPKIKKILFLVRADGKLGFPGGKVEKGEEHINALTREVLEEVGFNISRATPVEISVDHVRDNFYSKCYIYETSVNVPTFLAGFDDASHREESIGHLLVDSDSDSLQNIINHYPLAPTVKEEIYKFLDYMANKR